MAYPIQEQPLDSLIDIYVTVSGTRHLLNDYVTQASGNFGSVQDEYFCELQPGMCSFELYNPSSTVESYLVPGTEFAITTHQAPLSTYYVLYIGTIRDVVINYVFDDVLMELVPVITVSCADFLADVNGLTLPKGTLAPMVGAERMSLANFYGYYGGATGYNLLDFNTMTTTYINQQYEEVNALDIINTVCRSVDMFPYSTGTNIGAKAITAPTTYPTLITDGTHTGGTYSNIFKMIGIDYGYKSKQALSSITLNNVGLNRAPKSATDSGLSNVVVPYKATQSIGFSQGKSFDTCVSTDNLGWNYIPNNGGYSQTPSGFSTASFKYQQSTARVKDNYAYSTRCIVNATYTANSFANIWLGEDEYPDMVTSPAGGTTGNWYFRFYAQAHSASISWQLTPVIQWFDSSGQFISSSIGTAVTVSSNTTWTAVTVNAAKPTNAASIRAYFTVGGTVRAVGNSFYVTDASLGQQGGYFSFTGDTADTSSHLYTWTGEIGNSPSQKNTNTLTSLASTILARNTVQKKVTSVTLNAWAGYPGAYIAALLDVQMPSTIGVKICVNGVTANYRPIGYSFNMTPTSLEIVLEVTPA